MGTPTTKISRQFEFLRNTFRISLFFQMLLILLLISFTASCSKDSEPPEVKVQESKEQEEEPMEKVEEEIPEPTTQSDIAIVDSAVSSFMAKYNVPGAAIAISVNEKMAYSKGYGVSNKENNTATNADDVFRIASISKPFTATAIMKLVDEGKLTLSDKVFGAGSIFGDDFGSATLTEDELNITVDHLLTHGAGGWGVSSGGDPIDYEPQLKGNDFIEYVLNNWDLVNAPGANFSYSNTGYWLLARIIEVVSEQPYEDFVRNMSGPKGVTSFKTTEFTREDRESNEVEYYGSAQDAQWIYTIASRRDGDGGVVISAPDLLRFICAIDGETIRADLISANSQTLMSEPSEISHLGRGLGTWEEQGLLFFTGSLPGNRSWFYLNQQNGITAVVLLNSRGDNGQFDTDLNNLVFDLVKNPEIPWQTNLDQF